MLQCEPPKINISRASSLAAHWLESRNGRGFAILLQFYKLSAMVEKIFYQSRLYTIKELRFTLMPGPRTLFIRAGSIIGTVVVTFSALVMAVVAIFVHSFITLMNLNVFDSSMVEFLKRHCYSDHQSARSRRCSEDTVRGRKSVPYGITISLSGTRLHFVCPLLHQESMVEASLPCFRVL